LGKIVFLSTVYSGISQVKIPYIVLFFSLKILKGIERAGIRSGRAVLRQQHLVDLPAPTVHLAWLTKRSPALIIEN
jgi:hypothetical protein